MDKDIIEINIPKSIVKKYFPFLYQHPLVYSKLHFLMNFMDEFIKSIYWGIIPTVIFLVVIYWIIPKDNLTLLITVQSYLILILAILFMCSGVLLLVESYSKRIIQDTYTFRKLLLDNYLTKKNMNVMSKFELNSIIPIIAIKKFFDEVEESRWLSLLPKKSSSSEKTIQRLEKSYRINDSFILSQDGKYKEWVFHVKIGSERDKTTSIIFNKLWNDLLSFEIKVLRTQKGF